MIVTSNNETELGTYGLYSYSIRTGQVSNHSVAAGRAEIVSVYLLQVVVRLALVVPPAAILHSTGPITEFNFRVSYWSTTAEC